MNVADNDALYVLFTQVLPLLPLLVVWVGAGVVALLRWRRHPMVSLLVLIAVSLLTATALLGTLANWALLHAPRDGMPVADIARGVAVLSLIRVCLSSLAYVLLFVALFGWRTSPVERLPYPPDEPG